jgi:hypothetical protein
MGFSTNPTHQIPHAKLVFQGLFLFFCAERKSYVRFDERGVETKRMAGYSDTGHRKGRTQLRPAFMPPRHSSTPQNQVWSSAFRRRARKTA